MRTTVDLEDDNARALERISQERGIGLSEAVNELVRLGLLHQEASKAFAQATHPLGARIDVSSVAAALNLLEGPTCR